MKPLVGSYSMLAAYKNCAHAMARRYVTKDIPYIETPEMAWGNRVHAMMELRLMGKPLPVEMQHWEPLAAAIVRPNLATEQKVGITAKGKATGFFDNDVFFRGKVDVRILSNDCSRCYIVDWKTGNSKYEDSLELRVGALLLKARYPDLEKIGGQYIWLKDNKLGQLYDLSDTESTWQEVVGLMSEIEEKRKNGEWEKNKTPLCSWCNVEDCENWKERNGGRSF